MGETRELVVTTEELQVLLNVLHDADRYLKVKYPFFDLDVLMYDPAHARIAKGLDPGELEEARVARAPKRARLQDDMPSWGDVRDALLSAGALPYANHEAVLKELDHELAGLHRPGNPNPVFLAVDSNVLYTRFLRSGMPHGLLPPDLGGLRVLTSAAVGEELHAALKWKYGDGDVTAFATRFAEGRRVRGLLLNRLAKKGRKAKAGFTDLQRLRKERPVTEAPADATTGDAEENDILIARSYGRFKRERAADVVVLTGDNNMVHHALSEGVRAVHLETPSLESFPTGDMDERVLCRFLHDACMAFGVLHLSGLDARVHADWGAKSPEDWESEALLVTYPADSEIMDAFRRDLDAVRRIRNVSP